MEIHSEKFKKQAAEVITPVNPNLDEAMMIYDNIKGSAETAFGMIRTLTKEYGYAGHYPADELNKLRELHGLLRRYLNSAEKAMNFGAEEPGAFSPPAALPQSL
jgi:hypothetical protein